MKKILSFIALTMVLILGFNAYKVNAFTYNDSVDYFSQDDDVTVYSNYISYTYDIPANSGEFVLKYDFSNNTQVKDDYSVGQWSGGQDGEYQDFNIYISGLSDFEGVVADTYNSSAQAFVTNYSSNFEYISGGIGEIKIPEQSYVVTIQIYMWYDILTQQTYMENEPICDDIFSLYQVQALDTVDPVFTYSETEVDSPYNNPVTVTEIKNQLSVTDNVDGDLTSSIVVETDNYSSVSPKVVGSTYNVIFSVTDSSGNKAFLTVHITMVDEIKPYVVYNSTNYYNGGTINLPSWYDDSPAEDKLTLEEIKALITASDGYYASNLLTYEATCGTANYYNIAGSYVVTLTVTDPSGNVGVIDVNVTVLENSSPVITGSATQTVEATTFNINTLLSNYSATDSEDGALTVIVDSSNAWDYGNIALGSFTLKVSATDSFGIKTIKTIAITVVDTFDPELRISGSQITSGSHTVYMSDTTTLQAYLDTITAYDSWYGDITGDIVIGTLPNLTTVGQKTMNVSVTDGSGNIESITITVNVIDDVDPVINGSIKIVKGITATLTLTEIKSGLNAVDNVDGSLTLTLDVDNYSANSSTIGSYDVIYTATDSSGNTSYHTVWVWVVDNIAPVWIINDYFVILSENQVLSEAELVSALESAGMIVGDLSYTYTIIDGDYFGNETESGVYTVSLNVLYENQNQDVITVSLEVPETIDIPIVNETVETWKLVASALSGIIFVFGAYMIFKKRK